MKLFNTLSKTTEEFKPIKKNKVGMYHCGPTVYNYAHIGNLRAYVFADTIRRAFEYQGYKVKQIINITDVGHLTTDRDTGEDKVEEEAKKEHKTTDEIVAFYSKAFFDDLDKLNIETHKTKFPRASDHIKRQIKLIKTLEKKGFVYKTSDGIYFDTSLFKDYGKLGQIDLTHIEEGARVAKNPEKKNPTDFALWKFSKPEEKRQQEWSSPWGVGFPGWHIECSAMSMKYLGETFDIHTGGIDHIPVHHNNEIAQSECATGVPYAHYWLHNAFVNVEEGKMAKSKGNFVRLSDLLAAGVHPLAYRYWLLTAHYRSPVVFSLQAVQAAQNAIESLIRKISSPSTPKNKSSTAEIEKNLLDYINNDFDTPKIIALLHEVADDIILGETSPKIIEDFDKILGLNLRDLVHYTSDVPEKIKKLSRERDTARLSNDWENSDQLRKEIENMGFVVEDKPDGAKIYRRLIFTENNL